MAEFTEQSIQQQQHEALRRIRHIVRSPVGMDRNQILREVRRVAEDGLRLTRASRER